MSRPSAADLALMEAVQQLEQDQSLVRSASRSRFEAETGYAAAGGGAVQEHLGRRSDPSSRVASGGGEDAIVMQHVSQGLSQASVAVPR